MSGRHSVRDRYDGHIGQFDSYSDHSRQLEAAQRRLKQAVKSGDRAAIKRAQHEVDQARRERD